MSKYYITHELVKYSKYKVIDIYTGKDGVDDMRQVLKLYRLTFPQYKIGYDYTTTQKKWFVP